MDEERDSEIGVRASDWFVTTHWSVVLAAGNSNSSAATAALEQLCRTYWHPLYAFVRRKGYQLEDAKDLIQEFFTRLLERGDFSAIQREKGRFRSFLLVSLKHFLINEGLRSRTQKRGGGKPLVSLDELMAEDRCGFEPVEELTPELIFERRWALALLRHVLSLLEEEYRASGKLRQFEKVKGFLSGDAAHSQADVAAELGTNIGAVKQIVHQLRRRYRELLRQEVLRTVATAGDVEDELRHLIGTLRG